MELTSQEDLLKIVVAYANTILDLCFALENVDGPLTEEELAVLVPIKDQANFIVLADKLRSK